MYQATRRDHGDVHQRCDASRDDSRDLTPCDTIRDAAAFGIVIDDIAVDAIKTPDSDECNTIVASPLAKTFPDTEICQMPLVNLPDTIDSVPDSSPGIFGQVIRPTRHLVPHTSFSFVLASDPRRKRSNDSFSRILSIPHAPEVPGIFLSFRNHFGPILGITSSSRPASFVITFPDIANII